MRKLLLIISVLLPSITYSQSMLGIYGGYNNSIFYNKDTYGFQATYDSDPTFLFGFYFKERENKYLNMTWSIDYLKRSVQIDASYGGIGSTFDRNIDLNIGSVNLRFLPELKFGNKYAVSLNLGPYVGWIIHTNYHDIGTIWRLNESTEYYDETGTAKEEFNGLDLGFSTSLGFEIPISNKFKLLVNSNYSIGLNSIADGNIGSIAKINSKNLHFTCGLLYTFESFSLTKSIFKK